MGSGNPGRREFLQRGAMALAGLALRPSFAEAAPTSIPERPVVHLRADYIFIPGSREALFTQKENTLLYPASLTKLMTMAPLFKAIKDKIICLDDPLEITKAAMRGARDHISEVTGIVTVEQAIQMAMVQSYNDVAYSIAQHVSAHPAFEEAVVKMKLKPGTEKAFSRAIMMPMAKSLGMTKSKFYNSNGLPPYETDAPRNPFNVTTAAEFGLLCNYLITEHPDLIKYCSVSEFEIPGRLPRVLNTNALLENAAPDKKDGDPCPGVYGLKTGFINKSWCSNAVVARRGDHHICVISTGYPKQTDRTRATRALIEETFARLERDARLQQTAAPALNT